MTNGGLHVVFGTGPAGTAIASALVERGSRVRAVNRSGQSPAMMPESVEIVAVTDAADVAAATQAAEGASVVYQALNPPYDKWADLFPGMQRGVVAAARAAGARYVSLENLYMYGPTNGRPLTEETPIAPNSRKGRVRADMALELARLSDGGQLEVATARASDYYGPGVTESALAARVFEPMLAGKGVEIVGSTDMPHSYAYVRDVGEAIATLGTHDEAFGAVWHVPHDTALTQAAIAAMISADAGVSPKTNLVSPLMMRLAGVFILGARETVEMMYEFTEPFVVDSSKFEKAFGATATSMTDGLRETVAWYRKRAGEGVSS
jgi:nucleoside-diphosphate-sugar epimerase